MTPHDHRASFSGELLVTPTHKLSFSNSSLVSSGSSLSECYSRLSSVASVSGVSSSSIPIVETPSAYANRFGAQSPRIEINTTTQSPSPLLAEDVSAAMQNQLIITGNVSNDRPGVVFSLRKLGQPALLGEALRYVFHFPILLESLCKGCCLGPPNGLPRTMRNNLHL